MLPNNAIMIDDDDDVLNRMIFCVDINFKLLVVHSLTRARRSNYTEVLFKKNPFASIKKLVTKMMERKGATQKLKTFSLNHKMSTTNHV